MLRWTHAPLSPIGSMTRFLASLFLVVAPLLPCGAAAEDHSTVEKLGRGIAGMALGILEVPGNVVEETRTNGVGSGVTVGLARGLGQFVTRELVGFYQFTTAPFASPAALETAMAKDYPWEYFDFFYADQVPSFAQQEQELRWIRGVEIEKRDGALVVRLPGDLMFGVGSKRLADGARPPLRGLAETLARHPDVQLQVQGYTDATGSAETNRRLSEARAGVVGAYLVAMGLSEDRIETVGFGAARPVASNDTPVGRRLNRRVEIELRRGVAARR